MCSWDTYRREGRDGKSVALLQPPVPSTAQRLTSTTACHNKYSINTHRVTASIISTLAMYHVCILTCASGTAASSARPRDYHGRAWHCSCSTYLPNLVHALIMLTMPTGS